MLFIQLNHSQFVCVCVCVCFCSCFIFSVPGQKAKWWSRPNAFDFIIVFEHFYAYCIAIQDASRHTKQQHRHTIRQQRPAPRWGCDDSSIIYRVRNLHLCCVCARAHLLYCSCNFGFFFHWSVLFIWVSIMKLKHQLQTERTKKRTKLHATFNGRELLIYDLDTRTHKYCIFVVIHASRLPVVTSTVFYLIPKMCVFVCCFFSLESPMLLLMSVTVSLNPSTWCLLERIYYQRLEFYLPSGLQFQTPCTNSLSLSFNGCDACISDAAPKKQKNKQTHRMERSNDSETH